MAQRIFYHFFILLAVFQSSLLQRRIKDGKEVLSDKKYVVYLLKALSARNQYHGWLCGGAIITKDYVITSAACVQDVEHIYVISGTKNYVPSDKMDDDKCVAEKKKKVVLTCVPRMNIAVETMGSWGSEARELIREIGKRLVDKGGDSRSGSFLVQRMAIAIQRGNAAGVMGTFAPGAIRDYQLQYNKTEVWAKIDIAVIKVESSFDFNDKSYESVCSYIPQAIDFNTEKEFPKPGDDVIVLGWGHNKEFRKDRELIDLNQATLHYAPTRVLEEEICVNYFQGNKALAEFIASSMLCTLEPGNLDDKGELILRSPPIAQGCVTEAARLRGAVGRMCADEAAEAMIYEGEDGPVLYEEGALGQVYAINNTRRHYGNITNTQNGNDVKNLSRRYDGKDYQFEIMREDGGVPLPEGIEGGEDTPGICQNDHGGPLIAWRGGQEILVAVATLYKLDNKQQCMGPYLFTKTWCNGAFLKCIVDQEKPEATRRRCEDPEDVGFEIVRRHISWVGHRDGPADNERIQIRNQVPMSAFQPKPVRPK